METNNTNIREIPNGINENWQRIHKPVLFKETLKFLNPQPSQNFIDCTVGEGGHAVAILEKIKPNGKLLGIEADPELYQKLKLWIAEIRNSRYETQDRLVLVNDSYTNLKKIVEKYKFKSICGVLLDLGLSSWHFEKSGRGFAFQRDEPLDMRYEKIKIQNLNLTAAEIVNTWSRKRIEKILKEYGEERFAPQIANQIVEKRKVKPIITTFELVEVIKNATPTWYHRQRIHCATRTFQALRIAVNNELENLQKVLPQITELLALKGRIAAISYHSLEDRIVKNYFRQEKKLRDLFKKPIRPSLKEIIENPRSRSAKLRVAEKIINHL